MAPRDTIVIQELGNEGSQYDADVAWTPGVAADDLDFDNVGGNILILIRNLGTSGAQTATFISVADPYGRTGDIDVVVAQGAYGAAGPFLPTVWNQSTGKLNIDIATEDAFSFAAVRYLPQ